MPVKDWAANTTQNKVVVGRFLDDVSDDRNVDLLYSCPPKLPRQATSLTSSSYPEPPPSA
jgi:hypothetical protein